MARAKRKTAIGEWAKAARKDAGYSSADKAAAAAGIPPTWLRGIESGHTRAPSPERIALLEALYKSTAPEPETRDDDLELTAALTAQAAALMALTAAIGGLQEERRALAEKVDELDAVVRGLVQGAGDGAGTGAAAARRVPRRSTE